MKRTRTCLCIAQIRAVRASVVDDGRCKDLVLCKSDGIGVVWCPGIVVRLQSVIIVNNNFFCERAEDFRFNSTK